MISTRVVWGPNSLNPTNCPIINAKVAEMTENGKTDGTMWKDKGELGVIWHRTWTSRAAAEEWMQFVQQFEPQIAEIDK